MTYIIEDRVDEEGVILSEAEAVVPQAAVYLIFASSRVTSHMTVVMTDERLVKSENSKACVVCLHGDSFRDMDGNNYYLVREDVLADHNIRSLARRS